MANRAHSKPSGAIEEPARRTPVRGACDVLVVGGGIAGVAASVAAARQGADVVLVEKACALAGLATLGHVIVWLPLCDGRGRQVIAGLTEELLKLSVADLGQDNESARFRGIPACWQPGGDLQSLFAPEVQERLKAEGALLDPDLVKALPVE